MTARLTVRPACDREPECGRVPGTVHTLGKCAPREGPRPGVRRSARSEQRAEDHRGVGENAAERGSWGRR